MNLMKIAGRTELRQERQAELDAIRNGSWPRNLNDGMRWQPPSTHSPKDWAAKMCRMDLDYLDGLETRLAANDSDLEGWER